MGCFIFRRKVGCPVQSNPHRNIQKCAACVLMLPGSTLLVISVVEGSTTVEFGRVKLCHVVQISFAK